MKKCEKCTTVNPDDLSFCTNCGSPLPTNPAPAAPPAPFPPAAPAAPVSVTPVKKTDTKSIILIAVAVLGLIVGIVGVVLAITSSNKKSETPAAPVSTQTPSDDTTVANTPTGTNAGTVVTLGTYQLTIPKEYQYELQGGDYLVVTDAAQTWAAGIYYDNEVPFSKVGPNIKALANALAQKGAQVAGSGEANATGVQYYYIDFIDPSDKLAKTYSFFKAGIYTFEVLSATSKATYDHTVLNYIAPILSSAKEQTASRSADDSGIDIGGSAVKNFDKELGANIGEGEAETETETQTKDE